MCCNEWDLMERQVRPENDRRSVNDTRDGVGREAGTLWL